MTRQPAAPVLFAFSGLVALAAAMGIGRFILTPILPFMIDSLNLTVSQSGLIASSNFLGYLIGALLAAVSPFVDHRRTWLLVGLVLSAATTMTMGMFDTSALLIANRFIAGIASAFVLVLTSALVLERLANAGKNGLSAMHFAGVGTGIALSAIFVGLLASNGADWQTMWLGAGLLAALAIPLAFFILQEPPAQEVKRQKTTTKFQLRTGFLPIVVAYGLVGFGYVITATFIVTMIRRGEGSQNLESVAWIVVGVTAMLSVAGWAWAAGRIGVWRAFALASLIEAIGVAATVTITDTFAILFGCALLGGTFMGLTALGFAAARQESADHPGQLGAIMTAAFGLGQIIGPSFAGNLADWTGSFTAPSLAAAAALLIASALTFRPERRMSTE